MESKAEVLKIANNTAAKPSQLPELTDEDLQCLGKLPQCGAAGCTGWFKFKPREEIKLYKEWRERCRIRRQKDGPLTEREEMFILFSMNSIR